MHRYDIALNTWLTVLYSPQMESFSTGSGYESDERYVYIRKDAAHRFFKYDVVGNELTPLSTNLYPDGTALVGDKIWIVELPDNPAVKRVYSLQNSGGILHRMMLI